ncbi:hypothetical protein BDQ17DRAFT_1419107 [Cyathus striatus]|nr:hypothetical protein BDQ17DRAFT_1419107 [Cyathus striatus]
MVSSHTPASVETELQDDSDIESTDSCDSESSHLDSDVEMSNHSSSTSVSTQIGRKAQAENCEAFDEWLGRHTAFDWPCEVGGLGGNIEDFLEKFVPSDACLSAGDSSTEKKLVDLAKAIPNGRLELQTYDSIVTLLNKSQEGFDSSKTITFQDTHNQTIPDISSPSGDQNTKPDILGAYPGQFATLPKQGWSQYCITVEANVGRDTTDVDSKEVHRSLRDERRIARLLEDGRKLISASLSCYVFAIGMYLATNEMRIYRFDRSGCVSCGFNYVQKPQIIRKFLWKLVNPKHMIPGTVAGWDETIRIPTQAEVSHMQNEIDRLCPGLQADRYQSRWLKVQVNLSKLKNNGEGESYYDTNGFTFGPPLYQSSGMFSRATFVIRILVKVPGCGYHTFVLKDVWRERHRKPEYVFYETLQQRYTDLKASSEFDWIRKIYSNIDNDAGSIPGLADQYGYLDLSTMNALLPPDDRGHTTVTRRLMKKKISYERSRCRSLAGPVGGRLEDFATTKELVTAIRDAVVGHFIACFCGVLHRDISVGNILKVAAPGRLTGLLHDFDHATFVPCGLTLDNTDEKTLRELKEKTGTFVFMAMELLSEYEKTRHEPHHDLESFYWVLIWILLRHSEHEHAHGDKACRNMFGDPDETMSYNMKFTWIVHRVEPLKSKAMHL